MNGHCASDPPGLYLRAKLIELAGQPDAEVLVARIRARKAAHPVSLTAEQILAYRDEDRR